MYGSHTGLLTTDEYTQRYLRCDAKKPNESILNTQIRN